MTKQTLKFTALMILTMTFAIGLQAQQKTLSFNAIHASGNIEVVLEQGNSESVDVEANGVSEDRVITEVRGGVLKIHIKNTIYNRNKQARVVVNYKEINEIKAQAGARVYSKTATSGTTLDLKAGSGASIALEVWMDVVEGRAAEGGEIEVTGETDNLSAIASTGGLFYAYGLKAQNVYARSNTGGEVEVTANKRIEAKANTGGNISYRGEPTSREVSTNLGGSIDGK